jgi:hypothetical protein
LKELNEKNRAAVEESDKLIDILRKDLEEAEKRFALERKEEQKNAYKEVEIWKEQVALLEKKMYV